MSRSLTREQALRVLELPSSAEPPAVKRAYRRLARRHHPDVGGDPATFHRLQLAVERLLEDPGGQRPPRVARGRPSRPNAAWAADGAVDPGPVDLDVVDWSLDPPAGAAALTRDGTAVHLAGGDEALIRPLRASSRAPGSRLNRVAARLSPDLTAQLEVRTGADDRGHPVVALEISGSHRRARRVLDRVAVGDEWLRLRGSSTTVLRSTLAPSADRRATALRTVERLEGLLDRLAWPLPAWTRTP